MTNVVKFVLDGEVMEITSPPPTRTILQYLREDLARVGSKEGCAEGDCGACTVVIAELDETSQGLHYQAINACIGFLPTLHGKALYTVESLSKPGDPLHPVQQAMVDKHASQCGFCTPGIVMSLYAQYQQGAKLDRRACDNALSGNLCRCTGYRPIVDAGTSLDQYPTPKDEQEATTIALLESLKPLATLDYTANNQHYSAPTDIDGLAVAVNKQPEATLLAGSTDIGLWVTKQQRHLDALIYTRSVPGLNTITLADDQTLHIGAGINLEQAFNAITDLYPQLIQVGRRFASLPIRNSATLGGNVANASSIGDSMPFLMALNARLVIRHQDTEREISLDEFYLSYRQTALQPGEFIVKIVIPRQTGKLACYKITKRFDQDISTLCAAFYVELNEANEVIAARIGIGGMAATPSRAYQCENALLNKVWNRQSVEQAKAELAKEFTPISDMRASHSYRSAVAGNLLTRFFLESEQPETVHLYDYGR